MTLIYDLDMRRVGRRWWVTLSRAGHIVGSTETRTQWGARVWARRRARTGARYSGPTEHRESIEA